MRNLLIKILILSTCLTTGCAYYNTLFNAKKFFKEAEKEREKRLENIKKQGQSTTQSTSRTSSTKYDDAIKTASKVLEIYPKSKYVDDALFLLGKCFYRKEEYPKAKRKFLELIENFPNSNFVTESKLWLGKTNIELREYETAEKNFHNILNSKAKNEIRDEAQLLLGGLFKHKGDYVTAISEYEIAANRAKDKSIRANAYFEMGECYYQLKSFAKAVESFKFARKYSPDAKFEFNSMFRAGLALKDMEKYDEAIKIFTNLLGDAVNEESWPSCRLEIAHCNRLKAEFDNAIGWYLDIIDQHPKTEEAAIAYFYLGNIYQQHKAEYEFAKEYYDKAIKENPRAITTEEARKKSTSIQQMLTFRKNIEAQQKKIAKGDSVAAVVEDLDFDANELPKFDLTELDTLVAKTLEIPLDSLMAYQDTLLQLYEKYYAKHYDKFGEKIQKSDETTLRNRRDFEFILLDTLVAQSLDIPLIDLEVQADSLHKLYDKYYTNYEKNKIIYDQFYQQSNFINKNEVLGTSLDELIKSKFSLAEIYLFEFNQPDSALKEYIDILEMDTSRKAIPKTLFTIGYICETFKKDSLLADSVYHRLILDYPDDPFAQNARKKIRTIKLTDPEETIAKQFREAEKAYLEKQQYEDAITSFESIYKNSPTSEYAPKALLAMGWIYENNFQQNNKAFEVYEDLITNYPASVYAKKIKPKVDEVIKARTSSDTTKDIATIKDQHMFLNKETKIASVDSTQLVDFSTTDSVKYHQMLRREMEKNDPRRSTPRRW